MAPPPTGQPLQLGWPAHRPPGRAVLQLSGASVRSRRAGGNPAGVEFLRENLLRFQQACARKLDLRRSPAPTLAGPQIGAGGEGQGGTRRRGHARPPALGSPSSFPELCLLLPVPPATPLPEVCSSRGLKIEAPCHWLETDKGPPASVQQPLTADWVTSQGVGEVAPAPQPPPMYSPPPGAPTAQEVSELGDWEVTLRKTQLPLAEELCPGPQALPS